MHIAYISEMTEALPKWEMQKYARLWKTFGKKEFTNSQALRILREKDPHLLSVLFYDLKNTGWLIIERNKKDRRKKIYKMKEPNEAVKEMAKQ